jgi:hypothetical protein
MCYYTETTHFYRDCLIREVARNETAEVSQVGRPSDGDASKWSALPRLLRYFPFSSATPPLTSISQAEAEVTPTAQVPAVTDTANSTIKGPDIHHITQRTYIQCSTARSNSESSATPVEKRYCSNAREMSFVEGESEDESRPNTVRKGKCPVCTAAEKAVNEALLRIVVVSIMWISSWT